MSAKRKSKRGRPKGPCSPRELAQRRGAAWKHGGRAATVLRQTVHPCRRDLCPLGDDYPCTVKRQVDADGMAMEACLVTLAINDEAYAKAMAGDPEELQGLVAQILAGQHQLLADQLAALDHPTGGTPAELELLLICRQE